MEGEENGGGTEREAWAARFCSRKSKTRLVFSWPARGVTRGQMTECLHWLCTHMCVCVHALVCCSLCCTGAMCLLSRLLSTPNTHTPSAPPPPHTPHTVSQGPHHPAVLPQRDVSCDALQVQPATSGADSGGGSGPAAGPEPHHMQVQPARCVRGGLVRAQEAL